MDRSSEDGVGQPDPGFVLGILGASGGVGATAVATACAVRAAAAGREVVLVDAHPWAGGIEVMAGTDSQPGLRWDDLSEVRGDVDPWRLVGELPTGETGFRCLSWGAHPPPGEPPGPDPVLSAVRAGTSVTVVDLPRPAVPGAFHQEWWSSCSAVVLVVEASVVGIAAAALLAEVVPQVSGVVLRVPASIAERELVAAVGAPVLAQLPEDRTVARCVERGRSVAGESGALAAVADEVLAALLPGARAA